MPSKSGGPTATTADTKTAIISSYTMPSGGTIKMIRYTGYNGVIDKASTGILTVESDRRKGPWEYAVDIGGTWATTSGASPTQVNKIPCNIPVSQGEQITVSLTTAEALEENCISIQWG